MPVVNADVAAVFNQIADLLEVQGANPFRIRAYRNAARNVSELGGSVAEMLSRGEDLDALPGIGADLAGKIAEIVASGTCAQLESLRKEVPPAITELLAIPRLGPKRVRALHHELGVQTLPQLLSAAREGRISQVPGFGPKMEQQILAAAASRLAQERRFQAGRGGPGRRCAAGRAGAGAGRSTGRCRRQPAAHAGHRGRPRPAGHGPARQPGDGALCRQPRCRAGAVQRADPRQRRAAQWPAGRPAQRAAGQLRLGLAVLHRLEGAQHRTAAASPRKPGSS